ncbi:MAG: aldehyde ferredoxin oxidoreductase family protein [Candidatus Bathyarchaeota archaeon]|nr:aldehyde ferredoxin oxidoreductase family protein [Candidatus Bathyarchaeota archaeon]
MVSGYSGRLLTIDLTSREIAKEDLNLRIAREFIGGEGIASTILFEQVGPETDPLGPDNTLIFMTGAFVATNIPCGIKTTVVSKSPLTGIYGESVFSAPLGIDLKNSGYDGIIIKGKAKDPVYIWINDDQVEIREAQHLWSEETFETVNKLRKELRDATISVVTIGPAGERLVRLASIIADDSRAAGRCGLGAVMGSKNLKAIASKGTGKIPVSNPTRLNELRKEAVTTALPNTKALRDNGTASGLITFEQNGNLPIRNWTRGSFPEADKITGTTMTQRILTAPYPCKTCPIACGRKGTKEGLGEVLGEGVLMAAKKIGKGSEKFAIHVKGLEFPEHNPRKFKSMGVAYATSNVGANHNRGSPMLVERNLLSPELPWKEPVDGFIAKDKGRMTKVYQDICCAVDSLGICKFMVFWGKLPLRILVEYYNAITGWDITFEDLMKAGERIWNLQRAFNIRMGTSRKDDTLPDRFLKESVNEGPAKGQIVELETMLAEFYNERGLDQNGKPSKDKLLELGLDWVAEKLYPD